MRGSRERVISGLGLDGLKRRLGNCRRAGFRNIEFIRGFLVGVFELLNCVVYSDIRNSIKIHAG